MIRSIRFKISPPWRRAITASIAIHITALVAIPTFFWPDTTKSSPGPTRTILARADSGTANETSAKVTQSNPNDLLSSDNREDLQKAIERFENTSIPVEGEIQETTSLVHDQIQRSIQRSQRSSPERNLTELARLGEQLDRKSNAKSIDDLAKFLQGLTGSTRKPEQETEPAAIDTATAQIQNVREEKDDQGKILYWAELMDANGVKTEVKLDRELGEPLSRTMQLIKSNPLLEKVYRQVVMGLLDQILKSENP